MFSICERAPALPQGYGAVREPTPRPVTTVGSPFRGPGDTGN